MKSHRVAKFKILTPTEPEVIAPVLSYMRFVPTDINNAYHEYAVHLTGYSPLFAELEIGEMVPLVWVSAKWEYGNVVSVKVSDEPFEFKVISRPARGFADGLIYMEVLEDDYIPVGDLPIERRVFHKPVK